MLISRAVFRTLKHWGLSPAQNTWWLEARDVHRFYDNSEASLTYVGVELCVILFSSNTENIASVS